MFFYLGRNRGSRPQTAGGEMHVTFQDEVNVIATISGRGRAWRHFFGIGRNKESQPQTAGGEMHVTFQDEVNIVETISGWGRGMEAFLWVR